MTSRFKRMVRRSPHLTLALTLAIACPAPAFAQDVLALDFGPVASNRSGMHNVGLDGSPAAGATWIVRPTTQNVHKAVERSRDAVTIDSVGGDELALRVAAPAKFAHIAFFTEAGTQDSSELLLSIDGTKRDLGWLAFDASNEPRTNPRPEVRLFSTTIETTGDHIDLRWSNPADPVLLGWLQVTPLAAPRIADARLLRLLAHAGDTDRMEPLAGIREQLGQATPTLAGEAAVVDFWLDTMIKADRYFEEYRGWTWADQKTGLSMFGRYPQAIMWLDGLIADPMFRATPLYPRALLQRARLQYWMWMEGSDRGGIPAASVRDWKALAAMGVRPDLTPMYLGEKVPHASPCDMLTNARESPLWAVRQREALCRLDELLGWWVTERQAENGELGGKWGDDVEMLRWWQIPLLAGSKQAWQGWTRVAEGVWASDLVADGYHRRISDVEHAAEPISDTMLIYALSGEPERLARLEPSARQFARSWTGQVGKNERRFHSAWFGTEGVDDRPPRDRDVPMNARAVKAVRFYANTTGDAATKRALLDWSRMWAKATLSIDKGKPAGVVPPSIRFADGKINGDEPNWYQANMFWRYFEWSGDAQIYDQLLFASQIGNDPALRAPLIEAFDLAARYGRETDADAATGSAPWAARALFDDESFHAIWGQWRLLTGDSRYDTLLKQVTSSQYLRFRLTGDDTVLATAGQGIIDRLKINWPLLTSEVLFTDRVYASTRRGHADYTDMIAMMTGAMTTDSPYYHVTWHDRSGDLAYLVRDAQPDILRVDIASFAPNASVTAKFWQLADGAYCLAVRDPSGRSTLETLAVSHRGQEHGFELPAAGVYHIDVSPADTTGRCSAT
ncbi:hypothetical protein DFR49_1502 [Hephaestia caeni]|uniref:Uncharacterized protein n=1 Tax=Hephaestia caeni TaxID=645617 RepID=A0A397PBK5_9SPHN|nr:hypothetical protein [Hephaestia caeni]RIA46940.1 hypothetical protein DFR49_1502 [Hephaestia caeni]